MRVWFVLRILKWLLISAFAFVFALIAYSVAISIEPYRQVTAKLQSAPPLETFPRHLVQAVLVAEDPGFLQGSRLETLCRFCPWCSQSGQRGSGISITAHLVLQIVHRSEFGRKRSKGREIVNVFWASIPVDALWSKERVLSAYLNEVNLGVADSVPLYGMYEASQFYFGKAVASLSLGEASLLAGLIKGPSFFSPLKRPERAQKRRAQVLERLKTHGDISDAEFEEAMKSPLPCHAPSECQNPDQTAQPR